MPTDSTQPAILLFAKFPAPGEVKTRLVPALGEHGAAQFAMACLLDFIERLNTLVDARADAQGDAPQLVLCYAPDEAEAAFAAAPWGEALEGWALQPQGSGDLGARLAAAQVWATNEHFGATLFLGMDCPDLPAAVLERALDGARHGTATLVPAYDGGYVALALPAGVPASVFDGILWSSEHTGDEQAARIRAAGIKLVIEKPFADVDKPADLEGLRERLTVALELCPRTRAFLES